MSVSESIRKFNSLSNNNGKDMTKILRDTHVTTRRQFCD